MKNLYFIISAAILVLGLNNTQGQVVGCGTKVTVGQIAFDKGLPILTALKSNLSLPLLNTELSVTVYIIRDNDGLPGITNLAVENSIDKLNTAFLPINLRFKICNTIYVDNYQFNTVNKSANGKDLLIQNYTPNTINLYFASSVIDEGGSNVCGYTFMPSELKDAIIISKDCISGNEIIHQFGHFFNLYHTHETAFGKELVKDPNCNKTGDLCCDTPADPLISGVNKCEYTGSSKDSKNDYYVPSTSNYMSFSNDECRCNFTNDQFNRIIYAVQHLKNHLW